MPGKGLLRCAVFKGSIYLQDGEEVLHNKASGIVTGVSVNKDIIDMGGGDGTDILRGGSGADKFLFDSAPGAGNVDVIDDFSVAEDFILLERDFFVSPPYGELASNGFVIGTAAKDTATRVIYDDATGKLFFDEDGTGAKDAVQIAILDAHLALKASHFFIV